MSAIDAKEFNAELEVICGKSFVFTHEEALKKYGHDETEDFVFYPDWVVLPATTGEIQQIVRLCSRCEIPLTTRGGGTGLSGGALPVKGGVLLSMERFNRIIEIDERNLQATVESGVINEVFANEVKAKGLYYPPDPSSRGSCFLGGNIAHNAGGPRAVKYGVTRDYVLNLEVVLADGSIIWTGANTLKNSTGYSLTHLMIGSEGTLGIITKIVFRLIPLPAFQLLMLASFTSAEKACEAVSAIFRAGITPSALEFMERDAIDWTLKYRPEINFQLSDDTAAQLLIELDGNDNEVLIAEADKVFSVLSEFEAKEVLLADNEAQKNELWKVRRSIAEAVKKNSIYKEEDAVVKRAELAVLLKGVKRIGEAYGFKSVCYGHAGDGNLHINIIKGDMSEQAWKEKLSEGIKEIFLLCRELGGTISGEHGIGYVQKRYLGIVQEQVQIQLQKEIKKIFDPKNILNPLKIFPD